MARNNIGKRLSGIIDRFRELLTLFKNEKLFYFLFLVFLTILFGAVSIFVADRYYQTKGVAGGFFDAVYWAVVTLTTVGYGDIVPKSTAAKAFAILVILCGPVILSLITASISSIFIEKKIKEGKGLEPIKEKDHIIICGWNENGDKVIAGLLRQGKGTSPKIVLLSELERDEVQSIQYRYKDHDLRFVRGNFVKEDVLARANLQKAASAIILADISGGHNLENADERTIFGCMAIKSMSSKIRLCAELIHEENREHLKRTSVDEIVVRGESAGFLLAASAISPGVTDTISLLVTNRDANKIWRIQVPQKYIGGTFRETAAYLRDKYGALTLAIIREEEKISLDDILSDNSTSIDEFIKRKFEESGKDFFGGQRKDTVVTLNPADDFRLSRNDWLVIISKEKPSESGIIGKLVGGAG
jgi:voltage-gated potassium channel